MFPPTCTWSQRSHTAHQIRVHLQYLGHPIANDPIYASEAAFGPGCGKGGVDLVEQGEHNSQLAALAERIKAAKASGGATGLPPPLPDDSDRLAGKETGPEHGAIIKTDRVTDNVDITSPIRLSTQARNIIATLRRQRDEAEDWVKWKEVVYNTKQAQDALAAGSNTKAPGDAAAEAAAAEDAASASASGASTPFISESDAAPVAVPKQRRKIPHPRVNQGAKAQKVADRPEAPKPRTMPRPAHIPEGFCEECFVPVPDDPDPSTLFIYLHALRYTTERLGTWSTPLPRWAGENWDGDWRGWAGEAPVSVVPKDAMKSRAEVAEEEERAEREVAKEAVRRAVEAGEAKEQEDEGVEEVTEGLARATA